MATETMPNAVQHDYAEEDVGNILSVEHVNLRMPDQQLASWFYLMGLGLTRDPYMSVGTTIMWINTGDQQFHLPTGAAQRLRGHVGVILPSLDELATRLTSVQPQLGNTQFSWSREGNMVRVTCPWGNELHVFEPSPELGGIDVGVPYVELTVPRGSASGIGRFYSSIMLAPVTCENDAAVVEVGTNQRLIFREADNVEPYDGHHIAVYLQNYSQPYRALAERGLVTEQPKDNHQFRFQDIVDPETNEVLFQLEHEVRSARHPVYRRRLVNRMREGDKA